MTRRTVGYVELEWTCPRCGNANPGPRKFCNGCGGPQPEEVEFHQAASAELLTDEEQIEKAKAGPDVHCPYCNARNPAGVAFCGACGGDLSDARARQSGKVLGAFKPDPARKLPCPACGTLNFSSARECAGCGSSMASVAAEPPASEIAPGTAVRPPRRLPGWIVVVGGFGCLALAAFVINLLTRTEQLVGTVAGLAWRHEQSIEALGPVQDEAWADEIPAGADIEACQRNLRDTVGEPVLGSLEVCGTPYTVDEGSGFGEVVQDCVYEVYDDWCTYTETAWVVFDTVTTSGHDLRLSWPDPVLGQGQRLGERQAVYEVTFESGGEIYRYEPPDEQAFLIFHPGSTWLLEVNSFGGVVTLEPAQ